MSRRAVLAAALAALFLGACQRTPQATLTAAPPIVDPAADARQALASGDCVGALPSLRSALDTDPESLFLHYSLGVCASQVDAADEATREFRWVVANADPASAEAQAARRWLIEAGLLAEEPAAVAQKDPTVGDSTLRGVVTWSEPGRSPAPRPRQQLFLKGLRGTSNKALQYVRRTDESGHYEFRNVPPGTYKLTDVVAGTPKWRLRVSLEAGQAAVIDLGAANAASVRDDFPSD